ncbi:MAG TPA: hypothetical protein PKK23_14200 [Nitrospirales bacterium]|nr:hypothetical protein [Nitrospiraceae bacterium]HNP30193.1 hypothetical protein [Nitrospirales bacterium]
MPPGWVRGDALWQLAKVQAEGNDIQGARLTAGEIQPGGHRDSALRDIAQVQVENGDFAGALRTADGFQGFAFPNPFHLIIHEQIRHGDLDGAMSTALKIPEKFRTAALAQVSLYKAKPGEIQDILKSLSAFSSEEKDEFMPTVVEELAQARQYEQAMAIIAAINLPYLQSLTLERVARVQIKYQEWELAKATGARSGNVRIYQELALAWSQSGKMPEALDWVGHLSDPFAKTYGLIGITEALDISTKKMDSSFR